MMFNNKKQQNYSLVLDFIEKCEDCVSNCVHVRFKREVTSIEQMHFRIGQVLFVGMRAGRDKKGIFAAPDYKSRRLVIAEIGVERGIEFDVVDVIEEEVELDFGVAWTSEEGSVEVVGKGVD
jgi:hypothetical protein